MMQGHAIHAQGTVQRAPEPASGGLLERQTLQIVGRCLGYLRPYWPWAVGAYLAILGVTALTAAHTNR